MNCQNCSIEIPPTWTAALTSNICPACGQPIMNEQVQTLIKELSAALVVLPNNAEAIAGWIISNYNLTKIAEYDPTQVKSSTPRRQAVAARPNGVLTAADLLKGSKSDIDIDENMRKLNASKNKIPSLIKDIDVDLIDSDDYEVEEEEFSGDDEGEFDKEEFMNSQIKRVMKNSDITPNLSKPLKAAFNNTAIKQEQAKQSILSGSPQKGGFCRAE
jgi:hypothetical protein